MGYRIDAFIEDGKPSLKIWDIKDHSLCLSWTYDKPRSDQNNFSQEEIQRLFRKLLLLTLRDDFNNVRVFTALTEGGE